MFLRARVINEDQVETACRELRGLCGHVPQGVVSTCMRGRWRSGANSCMMEAPDSPSSPGVAGGITAEAAYAGVELPCRAATASGDEESPVPTCLT